jgi:hypothetical protein
MNPDKEEALPDEVSVALPLTVGMDTGLYSGFPMVRSNFPCA